MWYDLGTTHGCLYDMRNRLAMGRLALPRTVSPAACATSSAPLTRPHPCVGQKAVKMPLTLAPAASTTDQPTDASTQPSSAKIKDKRKKKKREAATTNPPKLKKSNKRTASDASSDTGVDEVQVVPKEKTSPETKSTSAKRSRKSSPKEVPPAESSDSQAEGPFTNRSDSEGTESAPESTGVSSSRR